MSTTVTTIPQAMSLAGAAHLLAQASISGAPVVDKEGRCVGVISATDFLSWAGKGEQAAKRPGHPPCAYSAWQVMDIEGLPEDEVRRFMTTDPVTVRSAATLGELAQMMVDAHIHRVIVVDAEERPVGIVSTTDILAAVAKSAKRTLGTARIQPVHAPSTS
jgi:CBS domain-containing protein